MSPYAPDGSPVALYLRVSGAAEAAAIHDQLPEGASILELGSGAGRLTRELVALGHSVVAVDNSAEMLEHVREADTVLADIVGLDLGRRFPCVLLWSHLIHVDAPLRHEFLATCRRHVEPDGVVLVLRHEPGWVRSVEAGELRDRDGVSSEITRAEHAGDRLRATIAWEFDGNRYEQSFEVFDIDDATLDTVAAEHGLRVERFFDERRMMVRLEPA